MLNNSRLGGINYIWYRDIRIIFDQACQYGLWKIPGTSSKKKSKKTFFIYNVIYEKKQEIIW